MPSFLIWERSAGKSIIQSTSKMRYGDHDVISDGFLDQLAEQPLTTTDRDTYAELFEAAVNEMIVDLNPNPKEAAKILLILHDKCKKGDKSPYWTFACADKIRLSSLKLDQSKSDRISRFINRFNAVATMGELTSQDVKPTANNDKQHFEEREKKELRELFGEILNEAIVKLESKNQAAFTNAKTELDQEAEKPDSSCFAGIASCFSRSKTR